MRRERNREPRRTFLEWYEEERPAALLKNLTRSADAILGIPLCFIIVFFTCIYYMGNGAYNYSNKTYENMEEVIGATVVEGETIDIPILQVAVNEFDLSSNGDGLTLVCIIRKGYFKAIVTAEMTPDYKVTALDRNYRSRQEYMKEYWITVCAITVGGAVGAWLILKAVWCLAIWVIAKVIKQISEKKETSKSLEIGEVSSSN